MLDLNKCVNEILEIVGLSDFSSTDTENQIKQNLEEKLLSVHNNAWDEAYAQGMEDGQNK